MPVVFRRHLVGKNSDNVYHWRAAAGGAKQRDVRRLLHSMTADYVTGPAPKCGDAL